MKQLMFQFFINIIVLIKLLKLKHIYLEIMYNININTYIIII